LRAIRSRLKPMGLDWDWPEFAPLANLENNAAPVPSAPRLKVRVVTAGNP